MKTFRQNVIVLFVNALLLIAGINSAYASSAKTLNFNFTDASSIITTHEDPHQFSHFPFAICEELEEVEIKQQEEGLVFLFNNEIEFQETSLEKSIFIACLGIKLTQTKQKKYLLFHHIKIDC